MPAINVVGCCLSDFEVDCLICPSQINRKLLYIMLAHNQIQFLIS